MQTILVVGILFLLSLAGAAILFKYFKSSAIIKEKTYQAGGAIAGFILIYGALYAAYDHLDKRGYEDLKRRHEQLQEQHRQLSERVAINGKLDPFRGEPTRIIVALQEVNPDSGGRFKLQASCIDRKDGFVLHVLREGKKPVHQYVFEGDDTNKVVIAVSE